MRLLTLLILCFMSLGLSAQETDNKSSHSIAYYLSYNSLNVNDPSGSTDTTTEMIPIHLVWTSNLSRKSRYNLEISYADFRIDASTSNIGQEVTQLSFDASWQRQFAISRDFHPYVGIGLGYSQLEAVARHTIDAFGFLDQTYPDRKDDIFYLLINGDIEFEFDKTFDYGFHFQHREPLGDGIQDTSIGLLVRYKL